MQKLTQGFMDSQQMADFFKVSKQNFCQRKQKYLEKLKSYADFIELHGKVKIINIYHDTYEKDLEERELYKAKTAEVKTDDLISAAAIARETYDREESGLAEDTLTRKFCKYLTEDFGKAGDGKGGKRGIRHFVWAVKVGKYDYRPLTKEEKDIFTGLVLNLYQDIEDKAQELRILDFIYKKSDKMTKDEYFIRKGNLDLFTFKSLLVRFRDVTKLQLVRISIVEVYEGGGEGTANQENNNY